MKAPSRWTPSSLCNAAEHSLLSRSYHEALAYANILLENEQHIVKSQATAETRRSSHRATIVAIHTPFRWSPLIAPRYFSLRYSTTSNEGDATYLERCAAVAWQSWYELAIISAQSPCVSYETLAPFWRVFTSSSLQNAESSLLHHPISMELLVLILRLCWSLHDLEGITSQLSHDGPSDWLIPLATAVLESTNGNCIDSESSSTPRDEIFVLLLTEWLPTNRAMLQVTFKAIDNSWGDESTCSRDPMASSCSLQQCLDFCQKQRSHPARGDVERPPVWTEKCCSILQSKILKQQSANERMEQKEDGKFLLPASSTIAPSVRKDNSQDFLLLLGERLGQRIQRSAFVLYKFCKAAHKEGLILFRNNGEDGAAVVPARQLGMCILLLCTTAFGTGYARKALHRILYYLREALLRSSR